MTIRKCYTLADNMNEETRSAAKMLIYKVLRMISAPQEKLGSNSNALRCCILPWCDNLGDQEESRGLLSEKLLTTGPSFWGQEILSQSSP